MRKLNMWQRLGVVASVLWILGGGWWARSSDIGAAQGILTATYASCTDEKAARNDFNFAPCVDKAEKDFSVMLEGSWANTALVAFGGVLFGWLFVYLILWIVRWVLAGRRRKLTD